MKQYPSNRILKKKLQKLNLFDESSFNSDSWNILYFSSEVDEIVKKTTEILEKLNNKEHASLYGYYLEYGNEEEGFEYLGFEYQTCDNEKCIREVVKEAQENYPNSDIREVYSDYCFDNDSIERCSNCDKPLNDYLTWVENEASYFIYDNKYWDKELIKANAFCLYVIFRSIPSCDVKFEKIRSHHYSLEDFKKDAYKFYTPLIKLAIYINHNFKYK